MGAEWTKLSPNANGEASQLNTYEKMILKKIGNMENVEAICHYLEFTCHATFIVK